VSRDDLPPKYTLKTLGAGTFSMELPRRNATTAGFDIVGMVSLGLAEKLVGTFPVVVLKA